MPLIRRRLWWSGACGFSLYFSGFAHAGREKDAWQLGFVVFALCPFRTVRPAKPHEAPSAWSVYLCADSGQSWLVVVLRFHRAETGIPFATREWNLRHEICLRTAFAG